MGEEQERLNLESMIAEKMKEIGAKEEEAPNQPPERKFEVGHMVLIAAASIFVSVGAWYKLLDYRPSPLNETEGIVTTELPTSSERPAPVTEAEDVSARTIPDAGNVDETPAPQQVWPSATSVSTGNKLVVHVGPDSYVKVSTDGGSLLEYEIDDGYGEVYRVSLDEIANNINVKSSKDDKVYVHGLTSGKPEYESGLLSIYGLKGTLSLPASIKNLELDLKTISGNIVGDIAHEGSLTTTSGSISIMLRSPLTVEAKTISGGINVKGMVADGRGRYRPSKETPRGHLRLNVVSGNIHVVYNPPN
jgi:hypothetical protein